MTDGPPSIYPTIRYDDATAAIQFLTTAFGFDPQEIDEGVDGGINHALLRYGSGLVMISSRRPEPSPFDHGTCCLYVAVDDPDAHHSGAAAAGAEIVMQLTDQPYGSREYAARDTEGNVWAFGTYRPTPSRTSRFPDEGSAP
jgi:uncharacterized glyoxalase superfamily protein PhnB